MDFGKRRATPPYDIPLRVIIARMRHFGSPGLDQAKRISHLLVDCLLAVYALTMLLVYRTTKREVSLARVGCCRSQISPCGDFYNCMFSNSPTSCRWKLSERMTFRRSLNATGYNNQRCLLNGSNEAKAYISITTLGVAEREYASPEAQGPAGGDDGMHSRGKLEMPPPFPMTFFGVSTE